MKSKHNPSQGRFNPVSASELLNPTVGENKMKLKISREDLLRSKVVAPEWYPVEITKVDEHPSKSGDSTNWDVTLKLQDPPEVNGVTVIRTFNEKAPGFAVNFLKACGAKIDEQGGEFDMQAAVGRKLLVYIKNETWNGVMRNKAEDFRPLV